MRNIFKVQLLILKVLMCFCEGSHELVHSKSESCRTDLQAKRWKKTWFFMSWPIYVNAPKLIFTGSCVKCLSVYQALCHLKPEWFFSSMENKRRNCVECHFPYKERKRRRMLLKSERDPPKNKQTKKNSDGSYSLSVRAVSEECVFSKLFLHY